MTPVGAKFQSLIASLVLDFCVSAVLPILTDLPFRAALVVTPETFAVCCDYGFKLCIHSREDHPAQSRLVKCSKLKF